MKVLRRLCFALVYALPAVLLFSYYPIISLGNNETMNFEFSLPLIWLVLFDLVAFLSFIALGLEQKSQHKTESYSWRYFWTKNFGSLTDRKFFLFALFPFYATLSISWSVNPLRAFLTAGIIWLIFFAVFALIYLIPLLKPAKQFPYHLVAVFFISTALVCVFCWIQCLLDVFGVSRNTTLLCLGCTSWTFGFPHPSGFAIEPQYMGNLLLAPTLYALYQLVFREFSRQQRRWLIAFASFFSATLFLTMSRGAIYAYGIALVILIIFAILRHLGKERFSLIIIPVVSFLCTLAMQGIFATISPTTDNFCTGTTKVIHQLSLGIIDLRPQAASESDNSSLPEGDTGSVENSVDNSSDNRPNSNDSDSAQNVPESKFDGYIPASTNIRLGLSGVALQTWLKNPMFGVGLGGAGVAISRAFPENELAAPNAIIQNEPISLLLELGVVGIGLVLLAFWLAFGSKSEFWSLLDLPLFVALIIAYLITLQFFSGPANALQIYLMPPLIYCFLYSRSLKSSKSTSR